MEWRVCATTRAAGLRIAGDTTEARCNTEVGGIGAHIQWCSDIMRLCAVDRGGIDDTGEVANCELCQLVSSSTCLDTYLIEGQHTAGRSLGTSLFRRLCCFCLLVSALCDAWEIV